MARKRDLRPSFFTNEYLAELPFEARLLFAGLWTLADRRGRLEDRPIRIKGALFPYDNLDVDNLLQRLADSEDRFIIRYEINGKRYIQITNFEKNQHCHRDETESTVPPPPESGASTTAAPPEHHPNTPRSLELVASSLNLVEANASCAEPPDKPGAPPRNAILTLTLNDNTEYPVFEEQAQEWAALYPAVDVIQQLRNMKGWLYSNPTKRKTKRGIMNFVNNWLKNEQDRGGNMKAYTQGSPADGTPHPDGGVWWQGKQMLGITPKGTSP